MKRYISYFAVLLAVLLGAACSKDDSAAGSDNRTGVMAMTVSTRQTADTGEYDPAGKRSTRKPPKRAASRRSGSRPRGRVTTPCPQA